MTRRRRRHPTIVGLFARAPSSRGKSRIRGAHVELRRALLLDTWDAIAGGPWDTALVFTPADSRSECAALAGGSDDVLLIAQRGEDLGGRMAAAIEDLLDAGYDRAILVGSDLPTLPGVHLTAAAQALDGGADVVLGPSDDGGYYLVGMGRRHPEVFSGIRWGAPDVLARTLDRTRGAGLSVQLVPSWYDVDSEADFERVAAESGARGWRTREALRLSSDG